MFKHLERAIELLDPKLKFGTYKESPSDIKLVNPPIAIAGAQRRDVILGYQVTLQPIKVGKFPQHTQSSAKDKARYLKERQKKQRKHDDDRDKVEYELDPAKARAQFDENLADVFRNNDMFQVEEPLFRRDLKHKWRNYIVAVINDIKEPDGSELATTIEDARQKHNTFQPMLYSPGDVIRRRVNSNLRILKLLHKPVLLVFHPIQDGNGRIHMYHLNGMEMSIFAGYLAGDERGTEECRELARSWVLSDPQWNDEHLMFQTHSTWEYLLHKSRHLPQTGRIVDRRGQQKRKYLQPENTYKRRKL